MPAIRYQPARGTASAGERIRLPNDPHGPEFWSALRQAQGITGPVATDNVDALIDSYIAAWPTLPEKLANGTQRLYLRNLNRARALWGKLPAKGLRPVHVRAVMRQLSETPGAANKLSLDHARVIGVGQRQRPDRRAAVRRHPAVQDGRWAPPYRALFANPFYHVV